MITKQRLAYAAIFLVCVATLLKTWVFQGDGSWPPYIWIPITGVVFWALWTLRDPPDPKTKAFDFNPTRGLFYFLLALFACPALALLGAAFGADLSVKSVLLYTAFGSVIAGIAGTFTEHVGI